MAIELALSMEMPKKGAHVCALEWLDPKGPPKALRRRPDVAKHDAFGPAYD
jgi:hypothetical protein